MGLYCSYQVGQMVLRTGMQGTVGPFFNLTGQNNGDPAIDVTDWIYLGGIWATTVPIPVHTTTTRFGNIPDPTVIYGGSNVTSFGSFVVPTGGATYYMFGATIQNPLPASSTPSAVAMMSIGVSSTDPSLGSITVINSSLKCTMIGGGVTTYSDTGGPSWCTSSVYQGETGIFLPAGTYYIYAQMGGSAGSDIWSPTSAQYIGTSSFNIMGGAWSLN